MYMYWTDLLHKR